MPIIRKISATNGLLYGLHLRHQSYPGVAFEHRNEGKYLHCTMYVIGIATAKYVNNHHYAR